MPAIEISSVDNTRIRVKVDLKQEERPAVEKRALDTVRPKVKLDGFRKGKAPDYIIKQKYASEIREEALRASIAIAYPEIEKKQGGGLYTLAGVEEVKIEPETFSYKVLFDLSPYAKIGKLKDISIRENTMEISREELAEEERSDLHRFATFQETESAPLKGDRLTVSYEIWLDETPYGNPVPERAFVLGDGFMDTEFELQILRKPAKKEDEFRFEKEIIQDERKVKYELLVTILKIEKAVYPDLTDLFVKEHFPEDKDIQGFRDRIRSRLEKEFNRLNIDIEVSEALDTLEKQSEFFFPDSYLQDRLIRFTGEGYVASLPENEKKEIKTAIAKTEQRQLLIDTLVRKTAEMSDGVSFRNQFENFMKKEFGDNTAAFIMVFYDEAVSGKKQENRDYNDLLNEMLGLFYNQLVFEYFQSEGLVKKGKKMSMEELRKKAESVRKQN